MSLLRASFTIGGYTLISRIFGFVRDMLIASFLGASFLSDAFLVAFKLPNFMRRLFAEGAFNSAFVPLYAGTLAAEGETEARRFAQDVMAVLTFTLIILSVLGMIFMPSLMGILAPGFESDPEKYQLTVLLTRITFSYILFISLVSLLGGMLNSVDRFAAVAATPIVMNICLIAALLVLSPFTETPAHALAIGVLISGVAQLAWLMFFARRVGILPRLCRPRMTENVKKLLLLIAPAALGAGVAQISLMIDVFFASHIPEAVSFLFYADRINELPLAVIGIAVGTALLPMLSRHIREGNAAEARRQMNRALEFALLLALPASLALIVIAYPIITTIFERGEFTARDTEAVYVALMAYAAGLPAFVMVKIFAPGFFANRDTRTPFIIATICVLTNILLNFILVGPLLHVGLALATSVTGWLNALLLAVVLHKRGHFSPDKLLTQRLARITGASIIMAAILFLAYTPAAELFMLSFWWKAVTLSAIIILGLASYGFLVLQMRVITPEQMQSYLRRTPKSPAKTSAE